MNNSCVGMFWRAWRRPPRPTEPLGDAADRAPVDRALLGAHARRLLDDAVLALAFARVERDLIASWRGSALGAAEHREAAYRELWALESVKGRLRAFMGDLQVIQAEQRRREAEERRQRERRERGE